MKPMRTPQVLWKEHSPSVVSKVKMAVMKEANEGRRKVERIEMTRKILRKIVKSCYNKDFRKVTPERRRFLISS